MQKNFSEVSSAFFSYKYLHNRISFQNEKQIAQTSSKQSAKITHEHETLTLHPIDLSTKSFTKITNILTNNNFSLYVKMILPFH